MNEVKFNEKAKINSQQTLVKFLKEKKYYFKPVSEYSNSDFYCMVKCEMHNAFFDMLHELFGWAGAKERVTFVDSPIAFSICAGSYNEQMEPVVFTQEDVKKIITDVPENYIGEDIL